MLFTIYSCSNEETETIKPQTEADIIAYLEENNINATRTQSGLYYVIEEEGTGRRPTETYNVTMNFKSYLLDNTIFNESNDGSFSFDLNTVVIGLSEGIQLFKEGGKGKLFIPFELYGNRIEGVPEGAVIVFDIDLLAIENKQDIAIYLEENNINATKTTNGLYYIIEEEGSGENPNFNSNVTVAYKGYLLNENVFDESSSEGISFDLNQVIPGWTLGIPLFKEGGRGKLFIPPNLAYGNRRVGEIPANSALIFDINLISIN